MSARPLSRREQQRRKAIDDALALVATARTDPGNGQLVDHVAHIYGELARPSDPTGTAARHSRLIATLAFMAAHSWTRWAEHDTRAAQAWLATLAAAEAGAQP